MTPKSFPCTNADASLFSDAPSFLGVEDMTKACQSDEAMAQTASADKSWSTTVCRPVEGGGSVRQTTQASFHEDRYSSPNPAEL